MVNSNIEATWAYHNATKHSYWSVRNQPHFLDWENQPLPFKIYSTLEPISLPNPMDPPEMAAGAAISGVNIRPEGDCIPDLTTLARILYFSAGITRRRTYPGGEIYFRAAACTGALYEIELYLVCGNLPDLEAGVYHFGVRDFALRRLRRGDYRGILVKASGDEPVISQSPAILICTGTYWRNAWKYRARTYRHFFWDNGTILANLLSISTSLQVPARIVLGFVDEEVNRLLDLDTRREVALSLVPLGRVTEPPPAVQEEILPLHLETVPLSRREVDYPSMRKMHEASMLTSPEEVRIWRSGTFQISTPEPTGRLFPLPPYREEELPVDPIHKVILRRGSSRQFAWESISFVQLSILLSLATRGISADFLEPFGTQLNDLYLIVHAVEGLPPGAYFFRRDRKALELLKEGDFRQQAGYLGLEQELPADASVDVFFLADLHGILERFGNRGYRAVQLEAGILGGKLYLAAYAQRLGATGLTFYDDAVVEFFSPHAAGKSTIFLVAVGVGIKPKS
ncbi:MAG TPA: SagB/ThcOx family dehydrogenase [Candidatus Limnocylindrales bacterium]|nr:SagB/ThcOx family dehydrogenase [Candidatus Limnocylindrales bacterium]